MRLQLSASNSFRRLAPGSWGSSEKVTLSKIRVGPEQLDKYPVFLSNISACQAAAASSDTVNPQFQVLFIDSPHQPKLFFEDWLRLIMDRKKRGGISSKWSCLTTGRSRAVLIIVLRSHRRRDRARRPKNDLQYLLADLCMQILQPPLPPCFSAAVTKTPETFSSLFICHCVT